LAPPREKRFFSSETASPNFSAIILALDEYDSAEAEAQ